MWYPTAVGSCVLKLVLGFEFLYTLPQEVKTAKQSLCPLTPSLCSSIKRDSSLAENMYYTMLFSIIYFLIYFFFPNYILAHNHCLHLPCSTCVCFQLQSTLIYILCKNAKLREHISGGLHLSQDWQHLYSSASAKHHTEGSVPTPLVLLKLISGYCYIFQGLLRAVPLISQLESWEPRDKMQRGANKEAAGRILLPSLSTSLPDRFQKNCRKFRKGQQKNFKGLEGFISRED